MKRFLTFMSAVVFLSAVFSLIAVAPAAAQNSYVGGGFGIVNYSDADLVVPGIGSGEISSDSGFILGLSLGVKTDIFRFEGEMAFRTNDSDTLSGPGGSVPINGDISSSSILLNGIIDIKNSSSITPFLGIGAGLASVNVDFPDIADDSDIVLAYQFIAGIGIDINPRLKLDLSYKYFTTSTPSYSDVVGASFDLDYSTHSFQVGIRYSY